MQNPEERFLPLSRGRKFRSSLCLEPRAWLRRKTKEYLFRSQNGTLSLELQSRTLCHIRLPGPKDLEGVFNFPKER